MRVVVADAYAKRSVWMRSRGDAGAGECRAHALHHRLGAADEVRVGIGRAECRKRASLRPAGRRVRPARRALVERVPDDQAGRELRLDSGDASPEDDLVLVAIAAQQHARLRGSSRSSVSARLISGVIPTPPATHDDVRGRAGSIASVNWPEAPSRQRVAGRTRSCRWRETIRRARASR